MENNLQGQWKEGAIREYELSRGALRVLLRPDLGGSLTGFYAAAQPLLRPATSAAQRRGEPLDLACFPLVPYSNRIAHGEFRWAGRSVQLRRNFGAHPHSIHGSGWQSCWRVVTEDSHALCCEYRHDAKQCRADWPWHFTVRQHVELLEDGCRLRLRLVNDDATPMPAGLGFHPYFPRDDRTRIDVTFSGEWPTDETCLPVAFERYAAAGNPWRDGLLKDRSVDQAFSGRQGAIRIDWPGQRCALRIEADARLPYTVMYVPDGERFFCVEPVSHLPDAHNGSGGADDGGLTVLEPGAAMAVEMRLQVEEHG